VLLNVATYPWRSLPDVTMERDGQTVTIRVSPGREYRYAVAGEAGRHLSLRRLWSS